MNGYPEHQAPVVALAVQQEQPTPEQVSTQMQAQVQAQVQAPAQAQAQAQAQVQVQSPVQMEPLTQVWAQVRLSLIHI